MTSAETCVIIASYYVPMIAEKTILKESHLLARGAVIKAC
jgi:hypothetical protein